MDDNFKDCMNEFIHRRLSDKAFFEIIDSFNYGIQIVAKTQQACEKLVVLKENTHILNSSEISRAKRRHEKIADEGYEVFLNLLDIFEDENGMTYNTLCKKAITGYMPKTHYKKEELMGYDVIRFPDVIHTKGDKEYEPFR